MSATAVTFMLARHRPNCGNGWQGDFPLSANDPAPPDRTPVVYLLYDKPLVDPENDDTDMPFYCGSTMHLRERLRQHARAGKPLVRWWCSAPLVSRQAAYDEERYVIRHLLGPELTNVAGNPSPRVLGVGA